MRSIIIGIDGAEPTLIQKWIDELPNLQKFRCFGKLESTLPPSSAPAWTSIVTGVEPAKHGIFDFFYFDGKSIKVISRHSRRMPAIWNLLSDIGKKSIVINVPVTYPPERINGIIVSGLLTPPGEKFFYPPDVAPFLNDYKLEHLVIDDVPIRLA
ncbi:MAG: alkaline phosphatase family protein, partial [Thermoplasmata archaeon]|nr:alkaline phosphatase family protein [Thermoplasmata archaeon]